MDSTSRHNTETNRSQFSTSPVYQHKRISHRYSTSPASSYSVYSSALAASYQQQLQQKQKQQHTRSHCHIPTSNIHINSLKSNSFSTENSFDIKHRHISCNSNTNGDKFGDCSCSVGTITNNNKKHFNSPPSPCLTALDSACRPSSISQDSSTFPSPSLSASSTDSVFSSASSTSMAHCSPILPNNISALLLHDIPLSDSSVISSPVLSGCSSPRTPSSPAPSTTSSPSPSPPPSAVRSRRTASTGSRTSQISGSSQQSEYFSQQYEYSVRSSRSTRTKRSSVGHQSSSSSPLSRPSSSFNNGSLKSTGSALATIDSASNSPQAAVLNSTRYICLLLLPLLSLLFFALGAQTSTNFETPAKYVV